MRDPNKEIREVAQMLLDMKDPEHRSVLAFDHSLGGGATAYLNGKVKPLIENGDVVTIVRYRLDQNDFEFIYNSNKFNHTYQFKTLDELLTISKYLHYDEIYINELVTYPFLAHTMDLITQLSEEHNAKLVMLFTLQYVQVLILLDRTINIVDSLMIQCVNNALNRSSVIPFINIQM